MTEIPEYVVRDSIELARMLGEPEGQLFLRVMEREVMTRLGRILSPNTSDADALKERQVVMAITGMVEHELLTPLRLAQGWMAKRTAKELVR